MDVRGYQTGPIEATGAFTSEIPVPPGMTPGLLNTAAEGDRPFVVGQPGMRHKYLPVWHDPATGALSGGGRYLFRTYADAVAFRDFLESLTLPGENTTFWNRPFFIDPVRFAWRVAGAHDLAPIAEHDLNRFERYSAPDAAIEPQLPKIFGDLLAAARRLDLAHVSLMYQPEHRLVGVLTTASREGRKPPNLQTVRHSTEALAARGSISEAVFTALGAPKIFDRTSLNLAIWLPLSEKAGGAPAIWPNSPPIALPGVEKPPQAMPRAAE